MSTELITPELQISDTFILNSARIVARLWVVHDKDDQKTIDNLIKANVGTKEQCEHLFNDITKPFIKVFGPYF